MAKAIYRRYAAELQIRYTQPEQRRNMPNLKWYIYPSNGEKSTLIQYYTGYAFSETTGISGTGLTGVYINLSDSTGNSNAKAQGYMYITPTEAHGCNIYDSASKYAEITCGTSYISKRTESYVKGAYLCDVILDYGSVPENARASDGYWYEFVRMVGMSVQAGGAFRDAEGFANKGGLWFPQTEIKANIEGTFK